MSDDTKSETELEFDRRMEEERKFNTLKKETDRNRTIVDHARMKSERARTEEDAEDLEKIKKANFGPQGSEEIGAVVSDNTDYATAAKNKMGFILSGGAGEISFDKIVPFFRKNLIFIGCQTGEGKSTAAANIAYSLLQQKNPATGKSARVLILSNEEKKADVYNRITCIHKGWKYSNHDTFTEEQIKTFNNHIPIWASRVTVIDNIHEGAHGVTTTIEGIEGIFENLLASKEYYDCIIIDYYQNVISSKRNDKLDEYKVQARLSRMLDDYKNVYPAPIVLFGQINAANEENANWFPGRMQGRKIILNAATCVMEMIVDKKLKVTQWKVWKNRFNEAYGEAIETGFENGKFVPYDDKFKLKIQNEIDRRAKEANDRLIARQMDKASGAGLKDTFKEEKTDGRPTEPTNS